MVRSRHNIVFAIHPSYSLFSGWNLDTLQCTTTSEYGYILMVQRCLHSKACLFRGNNDRSLCKHLQANSDSTFIWEIVYPCCSIWDSVFASLDFTNALHSQENMTQECQRPGLLQLFIQSVHVPFHQSPLLGQQ